MTFLYVIAAFSLMIFALIWNMSLASDYSKVKPFDIGLTFVIALMTFYCVVKGLAPNPPPPQFCKTIAIKSDGLLECQH